MQETKRGGRRTFLRGAAAMAGLAILTACGNAADSPGTATPPAPRATVGSAGSTAVPVGTVAPATTGSVSSPPAVQNSGQATTITWFAGRDASAYSPKQVDAFNKANKSIQISYQEQGATSTDLHDKFISVVGAKDSFVDIVSMDIPFVPEFAAAGWTLPVDDVLPKDERAKFYGGTLDGVTYNSKLYAVPWYNNGPGLFYRTDLFDKAGLKAPKTYDELLAAAKKLQTPQLAGIVMLLSQTEEGIINWMEYVWASGGDLMDEKLNVVLDRDSTGADMLQKLLDFVYQDKIIPEAMIQTKIGAETMGVFSSGGSAMVRIWYSQAGFLYKPEAKITKDQWAVTTLPSKDGTKPGPGCLGTWNLGISTYSKKQKDAMEVLRWLTSQEQQRQRMLDNGNLSARPAVFDDPDIQAKYPYAKAAQESLNNLKPRPVTPYYGQISANAIQPNFGAVMARQKTPAQGIKDMASAMRQIIKQ